MLCVIEKELIQSIKGENVMALIKCPECGKEVSTAAEACPHCGYPIKKEVLAPAKEIEKPITNYPKPKNSNWIEAWKSKARTTRITWTILFLASVIGLVISLISLSNDKQAVYDAYLDWTFYETKPVHIAFSVIFGLITFITLVLWLTVLITVKVRARQYDGYIVLVYVGFKHLLIVENEIQDSGIINRFLYGHLPNKKQVWVNISAWDGSVKMGIGKEGDEKNLV